jgi:hypothetical protein
VKPLKTGLRGELRLGEAKVPDYAAKIGSQRGNRKIIAYVEGGELFGEVVPVRGSERPLCEVVGEAFRKKVVHAESLKGVMKDGCVAALFQSGK